MSEEITFAELDLSPEVMDSLKKMGVKRPTTIQQKAIPLMMDNISVIAKAPTGTGKTFAFGIPILEAMCVGTPVLTSTGSCFSETGGDAALYADPLNAEEIASRLTTILADETLREQMRAKGKEQASKFTDEKVANNLIQVFHGLCAS